MTTRQHLLCSFTWLIAVCLGWNLGAESPSLGALVNVGTGSLGLTLVPAGTIGVGPLELGAQVSYGATDWSVAAVGDLTVWSTELGLVRLVATLGGYGAYAVAGSDNALGYGGRATVGLAVPLFAGLSVFARLAPAYGWLQQGATTSPLWHLGAESGVRWSLEGGRQ